MLYCASMFWHLQKMMLLGLKDALKQRITFWTTEPLTATLLRLKCWCISSLDWSIGFLHHLRGTSCLACYKMNLKLQFVEGQTDLKETERERENAGGKRWLWWRRMRCEIKGWEIKSVGRLRDVFFLEKCDCLIKGMCSKGENAEVPIRIKGRAPQSSSARYTKEIEKLYLFIYF